MELVAWGPEALAAKKKRKRKKKKELAVRSHITEGINLPRSASPNVSITTPPGTAPALLVAAARQLIRAKTENERGKKRRETGPSAAFGSLPKRGRTEKHAQKPAAHSLRNVGTLVLSPGRRDSLSSFPSHQNKSGMIDEYLVPPSFAPSLFQGQFISGSLLSCEVTKARDGTKAAHLGLQRCVHVLASTSQRLLLREAARLRLRRTRPVCPPLLSLIVITSGPDTSHSKSSCCESTASR